MTLSGLGGGAGARFGLFPLGPTDICPDAGADGLASELPEEAVVREGRLARLSAVSTKHMSLTKALAARSLPQAGTPARQWVARCQS